MIIDKSRLIDKIHNTIRDTSREYKEEVSDCLDMSIKLLTKQELLPSQGIVRLYTDKQIIDLDSTNKTDKFIMSNNPVNIYDEDTLSLSIKDIISISLLSSESNPMIMYNLVKTGYEKQTISGLPTSYCVSGSKLILNPKPYSKELYEIAYRFSNIKLEELDDLYEEAIYYATVSFIYRFYINESDNANTFTAYLNDELTGLRILREKENQSRSITPDPY